MIINQNTAVIIKACYWNPAFLPVKWPDDPKYSFHPCGYLITHNKHVAIQKRNTCSRPCKLKHWSNQPQSTAGLASFPTISFLDLQAPRKTQEARDPSVTPNSHTVGSMMMERRASRGTVGTSMAAPMLRPYARPRQWRTEALGEWPTTSQPGIPLTGGRVQSVPSCYLTQSLFAVTFCWLLLKIWKARGST